MENTLAKGLHIRNVYQRKRRTAKEHIVAKRELTIACIKGCKIIFILLECARANRYRNTLIESHRFKCAVRTSAAGSESTIPNLRNILTNSHTLDLLIVVISLIGECIRRYRRHRHAADIVRNINRLLLLVRYVRSETDNRYAGLLILIDILISKFALFKSQYKSIVALL